jgi:hypothetical protein
MEASCSDREAKGVVYFARMLDEIRLHAAGRLAPGYLIGVEDPRFFHARCMTPRRGEGARFMFARHNRSFHPRPDGKKLVGYRWLNSG